MASKELYPNHDFTIEFKDPNSRARIAKLKTPHGTIETPNYIFCGTKAALRCMTSRQAAEAGADIHLVNTYHLVVQPGADIVEKLGGAHGMTGWTGPMMTDSGGFQIFAFGEGTVADEIKGRRKQNPKDRLLLDITEEGAVFKSYINGEKFILTPESSIDAQRKIGADLIYCLDECPPYHLDRDYMAKSMEMSHRWEDRSFEEFKRHNNGSQALYGIVQGGVYEDLRRESCDYVSSRDFFGTAIGGSLGVTVDQIYDQVVSWCMPFIPEDRPVHLLGIGSFRDVFEGVRMGIDTFDCVTPTRIARHGWALMKGAENERMNLRNGRYRDDPTPLDHTQDHYYSQTFSKGYLHHLIKSHEPLAMHILSVHNIATMTRLMREVRHALRDGTLDQLEKEWLPD
jgi:queuine tRNA-ribosyltransferase